MKLFFRIGQWIYIIIIPVYLLMTLIRVFMTPAYASFEYNRPYFPEDSYGFSQEERLKWATYGINYLTNNEDISYLADLTFENGDALFIESELSHMEDVKVVVQGMLIAWYIISFFLIAFIALSFVSKQRLALYMGTSTGGWLTVVLIAAILLFLTMDFDALFTAFHHIFFEGETWLFRYSDTLIRLYPIVFWRDIFIYIMSGTMIFGLLLGFIGRRFVKQNQ
ncbi:MAG: TIGR01906 family membrane protein [Anaerolineaceae bacterium]|nr:TIGR01906 family membrane protein [Anaerolineaceae bacterium]